MVSIGSDSWDCQVTALFGESGGLADQRASTLARYSARAFARAAASSSCASTGSRVVKMFVISHENARLNSFGYQRARRFPAKAAMCFLGGGALFATKDTIAEPHSKSHSNDSRILFCSSLLNFFMPFSITHLASLLGFALAHFNKNSATSSGFPFVISLRIQDSAFLTSLLLSSMTISSSSKTLSVVLTLLYPRKVTTPKRLIHSSVL